MICLKLQLTFALHLNASQIYFAAACAMPSFVTEPRNVRSLIGDKAKFKLTFSGNPLPGIF